MVRRALPTRALGLCAAGCALAGAGCLASRTAGPRGGFPPAPQFPPGHRYALDDLIELAIHRNASLDVARYEAAAVGGLVDQVRALWLPALRFNLAGLFFDNDFDYSAKVFDLVSVTIPVTGNYNFLEAVSVAQILATGGKRTSGLKQARMYEAIKKLEVLVRQDAVAFDVANYYYLVCLTTDVDRVLDETIRRLRVYRQVSENLNLRGSLRASRLDYYLADYFVAQLEQLRVAIQAGRQQAYQALRHYVGVERDEPLVLASATLPPPLTPADVDRAAAALTRGFAARPELKQVDLFTKIRGEQVKFAKAAWLPNIALLGTYTDLQGNNNSVLGALEGLLVSLVVDVPIYEPARRGRLREALGLEQASLAFQRQIEDLVSLEIEVTAIDAQKAVATLVQAARARQVAAEHYQTARQAYSRELVGGSEVVTAIGLDMLARLQHLQALYAYHNARARLNRVTAERPVAYGH